MTKTKAFLLIVIACLQSLTLAAATVTIPTAAGQYIDWNDATLSNAKVENGGANIGSTGSKTVATFDISNPTTQDYVLTFMTGTKNAATLRVTLTDGSGTAVMDKAVEVSNTGSWTPSELHSFYLSSLAAGSYTLTFTVTATTGSYAGNWGNLAFYTTDNLEKIPGTLALTSGSYTTARLENSGTNVGYITNGATAAYSFLCQQAGVYTMTMDIYRYNQGGTMNILICDAETGVEEVNYDYTIASDAPAAYTATDIVLPGTISKGLKTMMLSFSNGSSYICNYKAPTFTRTGSYTAMLSTPTIDGQEVTAGDGYDWNCNLPADYTAATTTLAVKAEHATLAVTAVDAEGNAITVTDNGDGTYTLPTPALNGTAIVTFTLSPEAEATAAKTVYTLRLFHIGSIEVKSITIDGVETTDPVAALNADGHKATVMGNIYTTLPTVTAAFLDGSTATATATLNGTTATYAFTGSLNGATIDYTLSIDGVHVYTPTDCDETVTIKYTGAGKQNGGGWSNGLYSCSRVGDGWENSSFKFDKGDYTWSVPADVQVKQMILKNFNANYTGGTLSAVTSDGATVYLPTKHDYQEPDATAYDLIINLENHQPSTPIAFTLEGGGQPVAWFEFTVEKKALATAPVLKASSVTSTEHKNHCVVALTFDREMQTTTATIGEQTVTAEGGSATLYFPVWNLAYNSSNTFTIAAGAAKDNYNNVNAEAITIPVTVGEKAEVTPAAYDYVVATVDELKAAVDAVNSSNGKADAERKVIFLKNGDYDLGSTKLRVKGYNISLIGENRDSVIVHGTQTGITNPVLQLDNTGGAYLQDITLRNDLDWDKTRGGVGAALTGGRQAVLKHVALQSQQDTQVTGVSGYYVDCDIYGAVDFICGGGDQFYDNCHLYMTNPGYITAPNTSSALRWGYVFQGCTIDSYNGFDADGNFSLGRPWQNEPRTYFLNTTMNVKPQAAGWGGMSKLVTHFYEYNSVDKDGNAIDLSTRKNSPTSTNTYTPVLTDEEAKLYTVENVLGGTDSWLPTEETVETAAPQVTLSERTLSWESVSEARTYVIFKDGAYLANQTETSFEATEDGIYTVRSANLNGGLCGTSEPVTVSELTGITTVSATTSDSHATTYNLAGQRVSKHYRGIVIRNGRKVVVK